MDLTREALALAWRQLRLHWARTECERDFSTFRGCNSAVECQLPKLNVAGSNPVTRFLSLIKLTSRFDQLHDLWTS